MFTSLKPNLSKMHIFGTIFYVCVEKKRKLNDRRDRDMFFGYNKSNLAYLIYLKKCNNKKIRCVKFNDTLKNNSYKIDNSTLMFEAC